MKFKIVLVNFPFDNLSETKLRPALCLTDLLSDKFQIILAFISTQIQNCAEPSDFILESSIKNFDLTGLHRTSAIRLHKLITITDNLIIKVIGELPLEYHDDIYSRLNQLFSKRSAS